MYNGRRLAHGTVDRRQVLHVRVRGNHDGRAVGLELPRRHRILMVLRLGVWVHVPLRLRGRIRRRVGSIVRQRVCGVGIVVHRRMGLGRRLIVLVVVAMAPSSRMEGHDRRDGVARHHGEGAVAFTVGRRPKTKQRNV